ncbi:MAG: phosphoribosylamine--glycine ligase [Atribacterota bacterium]|nr:phosphoribosylamine--glycine ligase [Atribacterota bacterium]MDD4895146.1 phosphoribosylamine--glycine ligase [Atribacterota bacterium]MDD5637205.1 phosphoribosylamine--glycine ligase [Atribacterota bacterium]
MNILVIGSGGREHTIVWKLAQSPLVDRIYCTPGNAGIAEQAECLEVKTDDLAGILEIARNKKIDCTIVGPEVPLSLGIVDLFEKYNYPIFGPQRKAAEIESSKVFAKQIMSKYNIPTARFQIFDDYYKALSYIKKQPFPLVLKVDGLAGGKGVLIVNSRSEAEQSLAQIMKEKRFGEAGRRVVIEEFLTGEEVSMLVFSDGKHILPMISSQDHKKIGDNDEGLNTGGMGAYSPVPFFSEEQQKLVLTEIFQPIISGLALEGRIFKGVLYAGLILTGEGPRVLEFNARFGDPETQVILPGLKTDLMEIIQATIGGYLNQIEIGWNSQSTVCVVMASQGYPGTYEQEKTIIGLEKLKDRDDIVVFHAGSRVKDGKIVSAGGRVLGVTAWADTLKESIDKVYQGVKIIHFDHNYYRKDIGKKGLYFLTVTN